PASGGLHDLEDRPLRLLRVHPPRRGARRARPRRGRMKQTAGRQSLAPAVPAALALVCGTWLGAWAISGGAAALAGPALAGLLRAISARRARGSVSRFAFAALWLCVGFASGRLRIAVPADSGALTAASLGADERGVTRVEGVLEEFWTGAPPRARSRLR